MVRREQSVMKLKHAIEDAVLYAAPGNITECESPVPSSCGASLGPTASCSRYFGNTQGCSCSGRMITTDKPSLKPIANAAPLTVWNDGCLGELISGVLQEEYADYIENGDVKWMYYGSESGNLVNYPGFLWPRSVNLDPLIPAHGEGLCDGGYDPRLRPWNLAGATGPKNVVFILDTSGSMDINNRIGLLKHAMKRILDTLTHTDYFGIVSFDSTARTFLDLTTLAPAYPSFRRRAMEWVDNLEAGGGTSFTQGYTRAFQLVDASMYRNYDSACQTAYIFLTDGEATIPTNLLQTRKMAKAAGSSVERQEYHFIIGFGNGVDTTELESMACTTDGFLTVVGDYQVNQLEHALFSFRDFFTRIRTLSKSEGISWSERYISIPDIYGDVATASAPVYDKRTSEWKLLGVVAVDTALCGIRNAIDVTVIPTDRQTKRGCSCLQSWSYSGRQFNGCTTADWPMPWCAVDSLCLGAVCGVASISTGCWDDCLPDNPVRVLDDILATRSVHSCALASIGSATALIAAKCLIHTLGGMESCSAPAECASVSFPSFVSNAVPTNITGNYLLNPYSNGYSLGPIGLFLQNLYNDILFGCDCSNSKPTCACPGTGTIDLEELLRNASASKKDEEEENGVIIGIVVGAVILVSILFFAFRICVRKKAAERSRRSHGPYQQRDNAQSHGAMQMTQPHLLAPPPPPPPPPAYQAPPSTGGMVTGYPMPPVETPASHSDSKETPSFAVI